MQVNAKNPNPGTSLLTELLVGFGPTLLLFAIIYFFIRRAARSGAGGLGGLGNFGRSQARRVDPQKIRVTFDDVAGIDEAKAELTEIVDFLKNPEPYQKLGGSTPHGVLLYGPPGTGKTLLARAVAGEAHAAFFSIAASEFIEAIVGVGAARVRDLFAKAKEAAPAIIFIDELDAIGRSRQGSAGITGANDEREQTLDQILTEMDGFESTEAVIVLGATNRPEILDPALLRPGRFDSRVAVQPPDRVGRLKILQVHTRSIPLADDVDLGQLASSTPGMVGADLANLCNEAALLAARRKHDKVQNADFTDSLEKILLGAPRGIVLSPEDRERTAYHESGHALVGMLTPGADPVRKVSIIPRGHGAGRDAVDARCRPGLVLDRRARRQDQGRARRAGRRRGRVRQDHDGRGIGHRAADPDCAPNGRAMGHEREARTDHADPEQRQRVAVPRRERDLATPPVADRPGGPAHGRRVPRGRHGSAPDPSRPARQPRPRTAPGRDARFRRRLRRSGSPDAARRGRGGGRGKD